MTKLRINREQLTIPEAGGRKRDDGKVYFGIMRFVVLMICLELCSCTPAEKKDAISDINRQEQFVPDTAKSRLLKIIEGGWVNERYMQEIGRTHSPMNALTKGIRVIQLAFDISKLNGDTLVNGRGRLMYDGGEHVDVIFYEKEKWRFGMRADYGVNAGEEQRELGYEIRNGDTVLLLRWIGEKNHTERFHRVFRVFPEYDNVQLTAAEYYVNSRLFEGFWDLHGSTIHFSADGSLSGLKKYTHYGVETRNDHPASKPDELSFYCDTVGSTFAFTTDYLELSVYELYESSDDIHMTRGKEVYHLRRKYLVPGADSIADVLSRVRH